MIRVAIVAKNAHAAEEIASVLAAEELLDVVDVQISPRLLTLSRQPVCDVLLTVALPESEMLPDGPPVVALTHVPLKTFPAAHSPRALLPMTARTEEIVAALVAAASGLFVLTADQAVAAAREPVTHETTGIRPEKLTVRELEVLRLLADGAREQRNCKRPGSFGTHNQIPRVANLSEAQCRQPDGSRHCRHSFRFACYLARQRKVMRPVMIEWPV